MTLLNCQLGSLPVRGEAPDASLRPKVKKVDWGATDHAVWFTRTGDLSRPLTVTYDLAGTVAAADFAETPTGSVTFAVGQATA